MGHAFERMNMSLGKNLISVNKHIENLKNGENIIEEEPELESLSLILNALTLKIQERVNNINSKKQQQYQTYYTRKTNLILHFRNIRYDL